MQVQKYDVVVAGSGMGGLCAAALAVKEGYKTLVLEKREHVGGRFSTEEIDGFKCATGGYLLHDSGWVPQVFKEVGAKLDVRPCPERFYKFTKHGGQEFRLPTGSRFTAMFDIVGRLEGGKTKLASNLMKEVGQQKVKNAFKLGATKPETLGGQTLKEWLLRFTDNEEIHQIFDAICIGVLVAHSYEVPATQFFHFMSCMRGMTDVGLSPNGNVANMEELAHVVRQNGAVWTGSEVTSILIQKGKAVGVLTKKEGGEEIEIPAQVVISDLGPKMTTDLAGAENFSDEHLEDIRVKHRPVPVTLIHVASDKPLCLPNGEHGGSYFIGCRRLTGGAPLTNTAPELAPPGMHLLYIAASPPSTLAPVDIEEEKRLCMLDIKETFPDFEQHGRILKMDVRNIDSDLPEGWTWQGPMYFMSRESNIKNLYDVGDGVHSSGYIGTTGCAEGAKRVIELVKKRTRPS